LNTPDEHRARATKDVGMARRTNSVSQGAATPVCNTRQQSPPHATTLIDMTSVQRTHAASVVWISIPLALGLLTQPLSLASWLAVVLGAFVPAAVVAYRWREPVTSTSQDIRAAIR